MQGFFEMSNHKTLASDDCAVCLEALDGSGPLLGPLTTLSCGHQLHGECAANIRRHHDQQLRAGGPPCPLCRRPMPVVAADKRRAAMDALMQRSVDPRIVAVLEEAADLGDGEALCNLAVCHAQGLGGVPCDAHKAFDLSLVAANLGLATAQSNTAHMFAKGQGTPQDYAQAHVYWSRAATQQSQQRTDAMYNLGILHQQGLGTPLDLAAARQWFTKAASQGHGPAGRELEALST